MLESKSLPAPSVLVADWGTTTLRVWTLDATGDVVARAQAPSSALGVVPGDESPTPGERDDRYLRALDVATGGALRAHPRIPLLLSGMVGSREGWRDAGYLDAPASLSGIGDAAFSFLAAGRSVHIVPGIAQAASRGRFADVMRGEETQLIGVDGAADDRPGQYAVVLPGTHSKWVRIVDGTVAEFSTSMTGDLFAAVREHTVLARSAGGGLDAAAEGFERGLEASRAEGPGLAAALFSARSQHVRGDLLDGEVDAYLSGVLIGDEVRSQLPRLDAAAQRIVLCGEGRLTELYRRALEHAGRRPEVAEADAALRGLREIAAGIGLLPHAAAPGRTTATTRRGANA